MATPSTCPHCGRAVPEDQGICDACQARSAVAPQPPINRADRGYGLKVLMAIVFTWGGILAIGAGCFGVNPTNGKIELGFFPVRGLFVLVCVLVFCGAWILASGKRRSWEPKYDLPQDEAPDGPEDGETGGRWAADQQHPVSSD